MIKTLLCVIFDRSGSMSGKEKDVVGGVNTFIEQQKKLPDEAVIQLVRFDDQYEVFRPAEPLAETKPIAMEDYVPRGSTALLDAIGRTLNSLDDVWKKFNPERAIVTVITDGYENASREFSKSKIKDMITSRESSGKWSFIYIGAAVDAFTEANAMGFSASNTAQYSGTAKGTQAVFAAASLSVRHMRGSGSNNANLGGVIPDAEEDDDKKQAAPSAWKAPEENKPWSPPAAE